MKKIALITFIILLIDQVSKFYIKTTFHLGESVDVFPGFKLTFVKIRAWRTDFILAACWVNMLW